MNDTRIQNRYDEFQRRAVSNVVADFTDHPNGRFLLVIPTGGGKTFTAVKAVNELFETGVLDPSEDRVLWTAHRKELITQAHSTFEQFVESYPGRRSFAESVDFQMIAAASRHLGMNSAVRLVVIDEAHHAALKNVNYGPLFERTSVGILGLTATPSRHDGAPLEFDRESFSIGFPDLVKQGIVLRPEIRTVTGGTFQIDSIDDDASLEQLNNRERNQKIIQELLNHTDEYKKVIVYVGTVSHVNALYQQLVASPLIDDYESISFLTGGDNSRNQDRDQFLAQERLYKRSVLVNVMVLSEGYDDPSVNTVVMATPSHSKLYYMQAMGRAIRHDPRDPTKRAYCVEVEDTLPNIRYRIDNRWLFSDVSDALEPAVIDQYYGDEKELCDGFSTIYDEYKVPAEHRTLPIFDPDDRFTMLLFKRYLAPGIYVHFPIVATNENRLQLSNLFNFLSERMENFRRRGVVSEAAFRMVGGNMNTLLRDQRAKQWIYDAMKCAVPAELLNDRDEHAERGYPWITFVAFHFKQPSLPEGLLQFVADMVNREDILDAVRCRNFVPGSHILRLPLPLDSTIGKIVTAPEYDAVDQVVARLRALRVRKGKADHRAEVHDLVANSIIPIEVAHTDSLILIARNDDAYNWKLD